MAKSFITTAEFSKLGVFDEAIKCLYGKDFPICREDHLFHVFSSYPETASPYTGNDLEARTTRGMPGLT
jgi:hypothetical protein